MSGLIWAGIGKGIADAGATFGNAMARGIEEDRRAAMEAAREERLLKREEERDQRKIDAAEALAKKDAEIFDQAEQSAVKVGADRRFEKFKRDVGPTEMGDEELRKVFESQYDQRKVGAFEGADRYTERYSRQKEDVLSEIRRMGGSSGLINQARDVFKATQEAEAKADRLAFDEKRFEALMPVKQQQADAATTRAEAAVTSANRPRAAGGSGAGGTKAPTVRSTKTDDQGNVVAIMSDGSTKPLGIKSGDFNKRVSDLISTREKTDFQFKQLPEAEKKAWATGRLSGPAPRASGSSDNTGTRPPLDSFKR